MADTATTNTTEDTDKEQSSVTEEQSKAREDGRPKTLRSGNTFKLDVRVFLEGIQIPHNSCAVSYGIGGYPTATITLPAASYLEYLPPSTKVLIVFRDYFNDSSQSLTELPKYRVLFDGELETMNYTITSAGANIVVTAMHCTAFLKKATLTMMDVNAVVYNSSAWNIGDPVFLSKKDTGSRMQVSVLKCILNPDNNKYIHNMADLTYIILRLYLDSFTNLNNSPVAKWYRDRAGKGQGSHKLLYRVSSVTPVTPDPPSTIYGPDNINFEDVIDQEYQVPAVLGNPEQHGSKNYFGTGKKGHTVQATDPERLAFDKSSGVYFKNCRGAAHKKAGTKGAMSEAIMAAAKYLQEKGGPTNNQGCSWTTARVMIDAFVNRKPTSVPMLPFFDGDNYKADAYWEVYSLVRAAKSQGLCVEGAAVATYVPFQGDVAIFKYPNATSVRPGCNHAVIYDSNVSKSNTEADFSFYTNSSSRLRYWHQESLTSYASDVDRDLEIQYWIRTGNWGANGTAASPVVDTTSDTVNDDYNLGDKKTKPPEVHGE